MKNKKASLLVKVCRKFNHFMGLFILASVFFLSSTQSTKQLIFAQEDRIEVQGTEYVFANDGQYSIKNAEQTIETSKENTYGTFSLKGDIVNSSDEGIMSFVVGEGNLQFCYKYNDDLLKAKDEEMHLVNDKGKEAFGIRLDSEIMKGTIIVQTSVDQLNWITEYVSTDAFNGIPTRTDNEPFYSTTDIQLVNGCYYRVVIVYKLGRKTGTSTKLLVFDEDEYEYQKFAEVYSFYVHDSSEKNDVRDEKKHTLGEKVNAGKDTGFSEQNEITIKDPHYGWELGEFFISGYTSSEEIDGENVFLKGLGDQVTLWFNLSQDINKLNGKDDLSIYSDHNGYDQYFEIPKTDFGKGTLIIRHTNSEGKKGDPQVYTNYLEANVTPGADTVVQMFEEGDYEVALDYEICKESSSVLKSDQYYNYRIFFKFKVRNGNTMFFMFDNATGNELMNDDLAENGFRIDLAKSQYLKINVKREILNGNARENVPDIRFNKPAKDGDIFTEEGIYTLTATNPITGEVTAKTIYVGDAVMKAAAVNGLSIDDVNELVQLGGVVHEDGTFDMPPEPEPEVEQTEDTESVSNDSIEEKNDSDSKEEISEETEKDQSEEKTTDSAEETKNESGSNASMPLIGGLAIAAVGVFAGFFIAKRHRKDQ